MKLNTSLVVSAILASGAAMLLANEFEMAKGGEATLRPTHEALMQRKAEQAAKRKAERGDKVGVQTVEPGEIKYQVREKRGTLLERSAILCSGGQWAMVPTEAVIHVPSAYQARVNGERKGKLVTWSEFFAKNRGWLHTHSVSMAQARGDAPMVPEQVDTYKRLGRVVIAVCHNGPISVKPLKVDKAVAGDPGAK